MEFKNPTSNFFLFSFRTMYFNFSLMSCHRTLFVQGIFAAILVVLMLTATYKHSVCSDLSISLIRKINGINNTYSKFENSFGKYILVFYLSDDN